jgi:hypothetical protein
MTKDWLNQLEDDIAKEKLEESKMLEANPLLQFSTSQLKAELRRRKKGIPE